MTGKTDHTTCWVCEGDDFILKKKSDVTDDLSSENFAITNFDYGKTGELKNTNIQRINITSQLMKNDAKDAGFVLNFVLRIA